MVRGLFPQNTKATAVLIPYRIRGSHRGECARLLKLRRAERHTAGAPAVPDDDLTTLRVSFYLGGQHEARQQSGCRPDPVATQRAQGPSERDADSCAGHFFLDLGGYAGAVVANLDFDAVAEILCPGSKHGFLVALVCLSFSLCGCVEPVRDQVE